MITGAAEDNLSEKKYTVDYYNLKGRSYLFVVVMIGHWVGVRVEFVVDWQLVPSWRLQVSTPSAMFY